MSPAEPLINYLRQLERQGQSHINLDPRARQILRAFYKRAHNPAFSPTTQSPTLPIESKIIRQAHTATPPLTRTSSPAPFAAKVSIARGGSEDALTDLRRQLEAADLPNSVCKNLRNTLVLPAGPATADIMFIGEAPNHYDEPIGLPFSGPSGNKLDAILSVMGLSRSSVYLTNVIKYRPATKDQTLNNRQPTSDEIAASLPWLDAEISIIKPKVIILLGSVATKALLGNDIRAHKLLGTFSSYKNIPARITYSLSNLLHDEFTSQKREFWIDMLAVMELLNMPISERQRSFFKVKNSSENPAS